MTLDPFHRVPGAIKTVAAVHVAGKVFMVQRLEEVDLLLKPFPDIHVPILTRGKLDRNPPPRYLVLATKHPPHSPVSRRTKHFVATKVRRNPELQRPRPSLEYQP